MLKSDDNTDQRTRGQRPTSFGDMSAKFVIITGLLVIASMFVLSKFFELIPQLTHNTMVLGGFVIVAFMLGWLGCMVNDTYIAPLIMDRNRRAALKELGLDRRSPSVKFEQYGQTEDEDSAGY